MRKYKAFTLAEVLITLTIVGIIAALTIPTLITNIEKHQYTSKLKKASATLGNAGIQLAAYYDGRIPKELGPNDTVIFAAGNALFTICAFAKEGEYSGAGWAGNCRRSLGDYLNIVKHCKNLEGGGVANGCWHDESEGTIKTLDGLDYDDWTVDYQDAAILADGTLITQKGLNVNPAQDPNMWEFAVDVNGFKGPNTWGKDIYIIHVNTNGSLAFGRYQDNNAVNNCSASCSAHWLTCGTGCSLRVMRGDDIDWW